MSPSISETRIERAVIAPDRTANAARSLAEWYRREQFRLQRERELFRQHLSGSELEGAMAENAAEQKWVDGGWENSTLRRHLEEVGKASSRQMSGGIEHRSIVPAALPPAVRTDTTGTSRTIAKSLFGYAAVFDKWADLGWFKEKIAPGAFASALKVSDVRCLSNHDSSLLYGRSSSATLELAEDSIGLKFICYLLAFDPASYALARRIDRRDITGCSFSFIVGKDVWKLAHRPGEIDERTVLEIEKLFDVGPVTFPAYSQTSISATFEQVPSRAVQPASDMAAFDLDADIEEEFQEITSRLRTRRKEIERNYLYAGRIINRCKNELAKA